MHEHVVGGQVAVCVAHPGERAQRGDQLVPEAGEFLASRTRLGKARSRGPVWFADELEQQLGPGDLHRIRTGHVRLVQQAQRGELGLGPLLGDDGAAGGCPLGHRAVVPGLADAAAIEVLGVPVEHPVLRGPVALGREQAGRAVVRHAAPKQEDIGLLPGLQDAELGVDRGELGDQPSRMGQRTALGW